MKVLSTALNHKQSEHFYQITHGVDCDPYLYLEEIQVQKAWADGLRNINVLTPDEASDVHRILNSISEEIQEEKFKWDIHDEDIHMNIERFMTKHLGDLGKKLHLGRSRNDLIATTLKKYLANYCIQINLKIQQIVSALLQNAKRDIDIIVPSYTHAQAAQPIRMGHFWNYHALNFANDLRRFRYVHEKLMDVMPLGSGAIAGTHLALDLEEIAGELGFKHAPLNSIHGVTDRDDAIEFANAISIFSLHVVKFCDDVIFWSSTPVNIIKLSPRWSSGSSMMPNKRNPDLYEILRARFKKITDLGSQTMKLTSGCISGYASDLHELKKNLIEVINHLQEVLPVLPEAFESLEIDTFSAEQQLLKGNILATDIANNFVEDGLTFRDAYGKVAELVTSCKVPRGVGDFEKSVERKKNRGGTSRERVQETSRLMDLLLS